MKIKFSYISASNSFFNALIFSFLCLIVLGCSGNSATSQQRSNHPSLLIFTKTEGFRHVSISAGIKAIKALAEEKNIQTAHTEDARYFRADSLSYFDAVVFLNTTGNILNNRQQHNFESFIQNGGGFMGVHAAADTEYNWPWYGRLVGAFFKSHPPVQQATMTVTTHSHPATSFLPSQWKRKDEWYNYKNFSDSIIVLLELEEASYSGGENGSFHPISWYQEFEGGKVFYTGMGHTKASYSDSLFLKHLSGGISYVLEAAQK